MIWLPQTIDNSTYFAYSLEIGGFESRLYSDVIDCIQKKRSYNLVIQLGLN